jgi:TMEM175 potassium channel family protein
LLRKGLLVSPSRLHALIDGVFAIAVTLLVLDLPNLDGGQDFVHRLLQQWPAYAAYLVSFASIGVIWIEHHGMMSAVRYIDRRFLERTLAFLLFVSIIPWPTELAAGHIRDSGSAARTVAALYAAVMMLMGLTMAASWRYLVRHEQLVVTTARSAMAAGARRALLGALAYVPALILAPLTPAVSLILDAVIAVYFAASKSEVPGLVHAAALSDNPPTRSE